MDSIDKNKRWVVKTSVEGELTFPKKMKELLLDNVKILIPENKRFDQIYRKVRNFETPDTEEESRLIGAKTEDGLPPYIPMNIETEIEVPSKNEALSIGQNNINIVLDILSYVTDAPIGIARICKADEMPSETKKKTIELFASMEFYHLRPLDEIDRISLAKVDNKKIEEIFKEEGHRDAFFRAIQWYRKGLLEKNPESKFIFLWSSLEAMSYTKYRKRSIDRVEYYTVENMKVLTLGELSDLKKVRGTIVHGRSAPYPQKIADANKKLEDTLKKLKNQIFSLAERKWEDGAKRA